MAARSEARAGDEIPLHRTGPFASARVSADYPAVLDRVPAIIYVADAGDLGRWHYVSRQIETILGYSPEEWCSNPHLWVDQIHPDDRERVLTHERDSHASPSDLTAIEYRMLHRDGHVVWIRDDAHLVPDREGTIHWHGVLSDITDGKLAEAE